MLSVLLGTAFLSRQVWGVISDRIGGLATVLIGSAWQAASMTAFLLTQNEVGLFTVAAAFGLGFSRHHPGLCPGGARAVSGIGSFLENPDTVAVQWGRHGCRQLARWPDLRPSRILCTRIRRRHRRQHSQFAHRLCIGRTNAPSGGRQTRFLAGEPRSLYGGLWRKAASLTREAASFPVRPRLVSTHLFKRHPSHSRRREVGNRCVGLRVMTTGCGQ